jgi:hypothetical protein
MASRRGFRPTFGVFAGATWELPDRIEPAFPPPAVPAKCNKLALEAWKS